MSTTAAIGQESKAIAFAAQLARIERRARRRAKITAPVHIRSMNAEEGFEEVGKTVDVTRDGLCFIGRQKGYEKGQLLEVIFPYSSVRGAQNDGQTAEVARVVKQPHGKVAVALHFCAAKVAKSKYAEPAGRGFRSPNVIF